ncbi:hypothetical protein ABZU32_39660 [Sphaerisporangium sp. NPDC005288]|uniref:hypothetical protein n=1 Tax=Sphaerisporangium sp. NPDC005288 TaxID=3155114 RepID=UPI0033A0391C
MAGAIAIATRSVDQVVYVNDAGDDDEVLWTAAATVTLPEEWFDLVYRSEHVVLCGPADSSHEDLQRASAAGELLAVAARVRFW